MQTNHTCKQIVFEADVSSVATFPSAEAFWRGTAAELVRAEYRKAASMPHRALARVQRRGAYRAINRATSLSGKALAAGSWSACHERITASSGDSHGELQREKSCSRASVAG